MLHVNFEESSPYKNRRGETELKGNGEVSFYGVNYIIANVQEIERYSESVAQYADRLQIG